MSIPLIDLRPFASGDAPGQARVARQVDEALREIGFFAVTGHGVPADLVAAMTRECRAFFDLPLPAKLRSANPRGGIGRGYVPFGGEANGRTTQATAQPDAKEQIAFGRFDASAEELRQAFAATAFEPNVLPPEPAALAATAQAYYGAMNGLAGRLLQVLAHALGLPRDFFADKFNQHTSVMRVLNYPDQTGLSLAPGQLRSGEHTDFGSLTLLLADDAPGGLQVKLRHGGWADVLPPAGAFIVNIGDLMAVWTNDRWVSNLHRVVNPTAAPGQPTRRQSIAYFVNANFDALVECIPTCCSSEQPARHAPVLAGEHRLMKVRQASVGTSSKPGSTPGEVK